MSEHLIAKSARILKILKFYAGICCKFVLKLYKNCFKVQPLLSELLSDGQHIIIYGWQKRIYINALNDFNYGYRKMNEKHVSKHRLNNNNNNNNMNLRNISNIQENNTMLRKFMFPC